MNVEALMIAHLNSCGIAAYAAPPADRPERFATVELAGRRAAASGFAAVYTVAVQSWAGSLYDASELMGEVERAMRSFDAPDVSRVRADSAYRFETSDRRPRYQALYEITANV